MNEPRLVYGVHVANYYEGTGLVEAVFSTEAAAFEYAQRRSADKYHNSGSVTCWELDNPTKRVWLMVYQNGEQRHRNVRVRWPYLAD